MDEDGGGVERRVKEGESGGLEEESGGGGGVGWWYLFLWEDRWRRLLNSPKVPAETTLLCKLFHSPIVLGKKLFLKTGAEACWMGKHRWWFLANCCTTFFCTWFSDLVGLINLLLRTGVRYFSSSKPGRCPSMILKRKVSRFCRLLSCSEGRPSSWSIAVTQPGFLDR